ncbi:MAG TPA: hypothetical protein VH877_25755 [Polyangia bacterium]|jgi:hypothetical protein|nr:hypothetical protein [Polyangia bacterium]
MRTITLMTLGILTALFSAYPYLSRRPAADTPIVVLYSKRDPPAFHTTCAAGPCRFVALEDFTCSSVVPAQAMIVTGHSTPPMYLGSEADDIARVVRCYAPELVVLDTCYGFSLPLVEKLAELRPGMLLLGPTYQLPPQGLVYEEAFFGGRSAAERAQGVHTRSGARLERWVSDPRRLAEVRRQTERWDRATLTARLQRRHPNLVRVDIPGSHVVTLMPVAPERFR